MSGESFTPSIGKISNRGLIAKMEQWGWHVKKVSGEWTTMESPTSKKIDVRSGHTHTGNSRVIINEIIDSMEMSWEQFVAPFNEEENEIMLLFKTMDPNEFTRFREGYKKEALAQQAIAKEKDRRQQEQARDVRRQERHQARTEKAAMHEAARSKPPVPEPPKVTPLRPVLDSLTVSAVVEDADAARVRVINKVFDLLVDTGEPMSCQKITDQIPYARYRAVQSACLNLFRQGVVERLKTGIYQVKDEHKGQDVRIDVVARSGDRDRIVQEADVKVAEILDMPEGPAKTMAAVKAEPLVMAAREVVREVEADRDETINDVLDLLFPQGFRAKHLPLIDTWRRATIALIDEIGTK